MSSRNTKAEKRPQQVSSDEDEEEFEANDADIDTMMDEEERERFNQMSEKDREIEIYKRLEQREIQRTREQIKRKLQAADKKKKGDGETSSGSKKKKKRKISEGSEEGEIAEKTTTGEGGDDSDNDEKEDGAISSDNDDEEAPKKKKVGSDSGVVMKTEIDEDDDGDDGVANLSTAYHKPSEVANKQKQKRAMADLLNKRRDKKKQEEERRKKEAQKAALDLDEIFGNGDNEDGKSLSSSSSSSSSRSSSPVARSRTPSPVAVPIQSREQLIKCQVFRRRLARIVHAPFFAKTVTGCFVRVQIGSNDGKQIYRIAQIMDVVETAKVYEVEPGSEVRTNRGFKLKICNSDTQRVMRLEFLSNNELSESEFAFWLKRMRETDTPLPTVDFVERKQRELQAALNYNYTDAEISVMVREKQRFIRNPTNFAFQKAELLKQKEDADQNGDTERARVLQGQINDLEEKAKKIENQRTKNLSAITAINQRNRDHMKQIFLSTERMAANEHNKVKDDDPFTRKSARMKLVTGGNASAKAAGQGDGIASSSTSSKSAPPSASSSSLGAGNKLTVNLNLGGNDLFSAHGIDINIDLNRVLPATTTSSFRAPPIGLYGHHSQQNRPIASVSAPSNSKSAVGGGGSTRTLTLEEYKRKYSQRIAAAATTTSTAAEPSA